MQNKSPLTSIFSTFRNNEAFLILCIQVAVLNIGQGLITPILPFYAQTFAVSVTWVGFLLTSQALPRVFVNLPTGRLSDRWGAHRLLTFAAFMVTISAIGGGLAPNYWILLITRLLQGIGTGTSQTAGFTYTINVSKPETRARFISLYQGSFLLGAGIGPAFGGIAAQYLGYRSPFFMYALLASIVGVWMLLRLPDPRKVAGATGAKRGERPSFWVAIRVMLSHRGVMMISFIGLMAGFTRAASRNMAIPLRGGDVGLTDAQIGIVLSLLFIMTFITLYLVGTFADRYERKVIIVPSLLLSSVALVAIALISSGIGYAIAAAFFGFAMGIAGPIAPAYIADVADESSQGMAIGVFRTLSDSGQVFGPILMGWAIDLVNVSAGILMNSILIAIVAIAFWILSPNVQTEKAKIGIQA